MHYAARYTLTRTHLETEVKVSLGFIQHGYLTIADTLLSAVTESSILYIKA